MKYSFDSKSQKIKNNILYDTYEMNNGSKVLSHCQTEIGLDNIHSNESLSNIIDVISNNNLNLFYMDDDSTNFKKNIDNLNLKFYLETEKILSSNNFDGNNLFLILFKQITLYIKEIERLNIIILGMKKDSKSQDKIISFMERREMDFETKEHIIKALEYSNNTLEKKITNLILSENTLKQENLRLIKENMFYRNNNSSNINLNNNSNDKIFNDNKSDLYKNRKYFEFSNNNNFKKNKTNNNTKKRGNNTNNNSLINNSKITKLNKENKISKNNDPDSKSIIISVKRDEHLLPKKHRRNYSDQIGLGVLIQDNIKSNCSKKIIKNNCQIKKNNKNYIISLGVSTPKGNPIQIKNNYISNINIKQNSKYKNNKTIKNDNKEKEKILIKKKTDNLPNKSKHIDLIINQDKDCSLTKYSSSIFNNTNIYNQANGNMSINITENNYDFLLENEIEDLSMIENLLNQCKDYIKSNIN